MSGQNGVALEDELLLLLARGTLTPAVQDNARSLLRRELSWPLILRQAWVQGVSPLLYRNLQMLGFPKVPAEVRAELEVTYRMNAMRNTLMACELVQVLRLLSAAGVPVIPLKGIALAESRYGDVTLRVCTDIDILVPRPTVPQTFHSLLARGYRAEFTEGFLADLLLRSGIECRLVREERGLSYPLDLHWGLLWAAPSEGSAMEDLWDEAHPQAWFGVPAYTVSPEWELLFLAAHAARHHWSLLKWLVDIHQVCSCGEIEWEKVRAKARCLGWEEVLDLTLSACHALFGVPSAADFPVRGIPRWLKLFPHDPAPPSWVHPLRLLRRPSDRLRYMIRTLLRPTLAERRLLRLPPSSSYIIPCAPCGWGGSGAGGWSVRLSGGHCQLDLSQILRDDAGSPEGSGHNRAFLYGIAKLPRPETITGDSDGLTTPRSCLMRPWSCR